MPSVRPQGRWVVGQLPVTPGMRAYQAAGFQGEGRQGQAERPPKEPRSNLQRGPPRGGCLCGAGLEVPAEPALLPADRLLSLTLLAFEGLNTAASKDRCLACIEEPFFSPLWPLLLAVYRWAPAPPPPRSTWVLPAAGAFPSRPQVFRVRRRCHAHRPGFWAWPAPPAWSLSAPVSGSLGC